VLSVAAWASSFLVAFAIIAGAGTLGISGPEVGRLRLDLAALLALFGILAAGGVLAAARLAFGGWPRVHGMATVAPLMGVALAMTVELSLHEWTDARFSYYDWDMVGWTALLSVLLVTLAVATFAVLIAPRSAALLPMLGQVAAATVVGIIVLSNVAGITDGVEPESWTLAVLVGLSAAYAIAAVAVGARRISSG
jgi:hypothetical protein